MIMNNGWKAWEDLEDAIIAEVLTTGRGSVRSRLAKATLVAMGRVVVKE